MKKVCIDVDNNKIATHLESVKILNEFVKKGFDKRAAFIGVVHDLLTNFQTYENTKKLEAFWAMRVDDETLNTQLRGVLYTIENEDLNPIKNA
jgi:hypothetical protein